MIDDRGRPGFKDVPVGGRVFTSDGEELGLVREVRGGSFKIDDGKQANYWLPVESVAATAVDQITLNFPIDRLAHFKSTAPQIA